MAAALHHVLLDEDVPHHVLDTLDELTTKHGLTYWATELVLHRGLALGRAGEVRKGLALVREGVARYDALGAAWPGPMALCFAVSSGLVEGPEGVALVDDVSARLARTDMRFLDAEVCRVRGALLADMGDMAGAEAQLTEAIHIARDQGARHWELRTATSHARLMRDQGRVGEARGLLAPVHGWFTEGFGTKDLREARALLDELG